MAPWSINVGCCRGFLYRCTFFSFLFIFVFFNLLPCVLVRVCRVRARSSSFRFFFPVVFVSSSFSRFFFVFFSGEDSIELLSPVGFNGAHFVSNFFNPFEERRTHLGMKKLIRGLATLLWGTGYRRSACRGTRAVAERPRGMR